MREGHVSIAMPVRDCASTVGAAIRSILNQTVDDWDLIVIDDGSTDSTLERIRRFSDDRIRVHSDRLSLGLSARLNQAIELASGDYLARMDGDDIAYPERLERQVAVLESSPEIDLVGARMLVYGKGGRPLGYRPCPEDHEQICARPRSGFALAHPTWFGRLKWFQDHRYDVAAVRCEDHDLLLRTHRESRFANVPAILLGYREERVDLRKTLSSRYHVVGSVARYSGGPMNRTTCLAALEQAAKGLTDTVAVTLGAESLILQHRRRPLPSDDLPRWEEVWRGTRGG
jgi:glycosyltransferase involved in cell wall biosynthesis